MTENQRPALKFVIKLMLIAGGYRKKKNILSIFTPISIITSVVLMFLDLIVNWTGIETLQKIAYLPGFFITACKSFIMIINASELINLIESINNFWPANIFDKHSQQKINKIFKILYYYFISYWSFAFLIGIYMGIIMPLLNLEQRVFSMVNFSFCPIDNLYCWLVNYIWQIVLLMTQVMPVAIAFDALFIILIAYIICGCMLLKEGLKQMDTEDSHRRHLLLKKIVNQHDFILSFVDAFNGMITIVMLLQFWCSLWSMILFLFLMLTSGISGHYADFVYYLIIYSIYVFQLFTYSFGGAILEEQLLKLSTYIFMVNWHGKGRTNLRKDLAFMIFRVQRTRVLNTGKMSDLNLMLFISVVKNSFSVFTLIWQLDNTNDAPLPI